MHRDVVRKYALLQKSVDFLSICLFLPYSSNDGYVTNKFFIQCQELRTWYSMVGYKTFVIEIRKHFEQFYK